MPSLPEEAGPHFRKGSRKRRRLPRSIKVWDVLTEPTDPRGRPLSRQGREFLTTVPLVVREHRARGTDSELRVGGGVLRFSGHSSERPDLLYPARGGRPADGPLPRQLHFQNRL